MTATSSVLLTYVFPAIGCVISLLTFSSSFVAVLQVRRTKRLGVSVCRHHFATRFTWIAADETHGVTCVSPHVTSSTARDLHALQELNPIPYTGILGLTSGQVIYGSLIKNWFVFFANAPGLLIGLWLILSTVPHATPKVSLKKSQTQLFVLYTFVVHTLNIAQIVCCLSLTAVYANAC